MPDFIRSVVAQEETITASAVATYDLPVNPLSFIQYVLRWQDGAVMGNTADPIADAMSFISKLEVLFRGQAIMSMSMADLWFMMTAITGWRPSIMNLVDAASERHYLSLIIPFSRRPYDPEEAFPPSRRGELQLQVTSTAAVGTVDSPAHIIETVELVDAMPNRFLKCTTISKTPSAAGEHDVDLPIGNQILGVGLFATRSDRRGHEPRYRRDARTRGQRGAEDIEVELGGLPAGTYYAERPGYDDQSAHTSSSGEHRRRDWWGRVRDHWRGALRVPGLRSDA
jgi:hypothetical protein